VNPEIVIVYLRTKKEQIAGFEVLCNYNFEILINASAWRSLFKMTPFIVTIMWYIAANLI